MKVITANLTGVELSSEPSWPHWLLRSEEGRARVLALCRALELEPDFTLQDLGLPAQVDWRFAGPRRWALCYGGRVAYEDE